MTTQRADGYYWIKLRASGDRLIAEWFDSQWWRTADDEPLNPKDVVVKSPRIKLTD